MATVFVYDNYTNRMYRYTLRESDPMPYSYGSTLRVREFRGSSASDAVDHRARHGSVESHPAQLRQRHLCGLCL